MKIEVARYSGFCFGVQRAIDIAKEVAQDHDGPTYVHGQLVHNERVIDELKKQNIICVDELSEIPAGAQTVLRAHGEPGTTYETLASKKIDKNSTLKDGTCPLVTLVHNVAITLKNAGYEVAVFGKRTHPETIGTSYHLKGKETYVIESEDGASDFLSYVKEGGFEKVAIISQTTVSVRGYRHLLDEVNRLSEQELVEIPLSLKELDAPFAYVDTVCNPTKQRQSGTEELAQRADVMIVIGGLRSSNSKELAAKCKELGVETHYIQGSDQVDEEWFSGRELIGVSAGASTPDIVINEVVDKISLLTGASVERDERSNVRVEI